MCNYWKYTVDERRIGWWFLFPFNNGTFVIKKPRKIYAVFIMLPTRNYAYILLTWVFLRLKLHSSQMSFFCEPIGTAATPGLLCQPRVIVKMIVEKQMECRLAGETEVLGGNLPQRHYCPSQNPTWPDPGLNPGRRGGKPATNRLSYGAAFHRCLPWESFLIKCHLK
jgi:hypothetical protein